ncbi:MAG: hypothetical protein GZ085_13020 [Sulfuriferula multivorans]|uniref:Uncharacterized protein n=1 Tax=Sulfuriferula multivorans TaxID=1559896 RepID=A0A7C9TBA0_9PROT|nr:hypothetical protein [Sulfuriferula multivorans]
MKRPPFAVLKLSMLLVLVSFVLTAGGALWSWNQAQNAAAELRQENIALNSARQKLDRSRQQQQLIATHLNAYQALAVRGFIGAEDRLAWIEAAQNANRDAGLYGLDYRLTPRMASPPALAQGLALGQTNMKLIFPVLVETDLPRFLAALKARASGVVRVSGCSLTMQGTLAFEALNQPHMQAECELQWYTVAEKTGGGS